MIESNMSSADANTESGVQQLEKASRYQKKARNKMCCMLLIVVVILVILVASLCSGGKC